MADRNQVDTRHRKRESRKGAAASDGTRARAQASWGPGPSREAEPREWEGTQSRSSQGLAHVVTGLGGPTVCCLWLESQGGRWCESCLSPKAPNREHLCLRAGGRPRSSRQSDLTFPLPCGSAGTSADGAMLPTLATGILETHPVVLPQLPRGPVAQASGQKSSHTCVKGVRELAAWVPERGLSRHKESPCGRSRPAPGLGCSRSSWEPEPRGQGPSGRVSPPRGLERPLRPGASPFLTGVGATGEWRSGGRAPPCTWWAVGLNSDPEVRCESLEPSGWP